MFSDQFISSLVSFCWGVAGSEVSTVEEAVSLSDLESVCGRSARISGLKLESPVSKVQTLDMSLVILRKILHYWSFFKQPRKSTWIISGFVGQI